MTTKLYNGKIITCETILEGCNLYYDENIITDITPQHLPCDREIDAEGHYIAAGFIDIHTHGGGGSDFMDGTAQAYLNAAALHAKHGTTALVPTTLSGDMSEIKNTFRVYEQVKTQKHDGSKFLGLHLEGPYFSMAQRGAQDPKYIKNPCADEYEEILSWSDDIVRWSAAPELPGSSKFAQALTAKNILVSAGHSDAAYEQVLNGFHHGFTHITHLYSGMSTVHRINAFRYAGMVESAYLIDDMTVEVIADGIHVPQSLLQFVYKFKPTDKIVLVTDSMRGAGQDSGESILGSLEKGQKVIIEDGVAKLPDKSAFAGSVATADRLVRNMYELTDASLPQAVNMMTKNPAKIMGFEKIGELKKGYCADIVIFDEHINIQKTIVDGRIVYG